MDGCWFLPPTPSAPAKPHPCTPALAGSALPLEVRLAGGASPAEGRLELRVNGSWAGVCATGWAPDLQPVAAVACRSLGMRGGAVRARAFYGASTRVAVAGLRCTGGEASLAGCSLEGVDPPGYCSPEDGVGVACAGKAGAGPEWAAELSVLRVPACHRSGPPGWRVAS